jgi:hypothetical protein
MWRLCPARLNTALAAATTNDSPTMEEIAQTLRKYDEEYVRQNFTDAASINAFALSFYKDAADIYDAVTRVRNVERNPHGFDLHPGPHQATQMPIWDRGSTRALFVRSKVASPCAEFMYKRKTLISGPGCCDVGGVGGF